MAAMSFSVITLGLLATLLFLDLEIAGVYECIQSIKDIDLKLVLVAFNNTVFRGTLQIRQKIMAQQTKCTQNTIYYV